MLMTFKGRAFMPHKIMREWGKCNFNDLLTATEINLKNHKMLSLDGL